MTIPFHLAALGYRADPTDPLRFIPAPDKAHPFYPVTFESPTSKTLDDCVKAIAESAYESGYQEGHTTGIEEDRSDPGITDAERI